MTSEHRTEYLLRRIGPRLRTMRNDRNLTLSDITDQTGISQSTLSRLESGKRRPSLELLLPLAELFRVPLDDLVGSPQIGDPRINIRPFARGGIIHLNLSGGDCGSKSSSTPHGGNSSNGGGGNSNDADSPGAVSAHKGVIPGTRNPGEQTPDPRSHPGREWIYVLAGTLRLVLDGHEYTVEPGEAAEFDCTLPHWFGAGGPQAVEYLGLSSRSGERVHLTTTIPEPLGSAQIEPN